MLIALVALMAWTPEAVAFEQYSVDRDTGNCADCHFNFRNPPQAEGDPFGYVSNKDGTNWLDDLHDAHRNAMLDGDCDTCHSTGGRFPVLLGSSNGGTGLDPISCLGCHGRAEAEAGGAVTGAGLRQHHFMTTPIRRTSQRSLKTSRRPTTSPRTPTIPTSRQTPAMQTRCRAMKPSTV
jgi:hypothetical protein